MNIEEWVEVLMVRAMEIKKRVVYGGSRFRADVIPLIERVREALDEIEKGLNA